MAAKVSITEILQDIRRKTNEPYRWRQVRWLKPLFILRLAATAAYVLSVLGLLTAASYTGIEWLLNAGITLCLYLLTAANSRYRPAAVLLTLSLMIGLVSSQAGAPPLLVTLSSLSALISSIFEFTGHGKIAGQQDVLLEHRWNTLFLWSIGAMFAGAFAFFITLMLSYLVQSQSLWMSLLLLFITYAPDLVVDILYLVYLGRTIKLVKQEGDIQ